MPILRVTEVSFREHHNETHCCRRRHVADSVRFVGGEGLDHSLGRREVADELALGIGIVAETGQDARCRHGDSGAHLYDPV